MNERAAAQDDRHGLQDTAYNHVRERILDGTFAPGRRLSEPELAEILGMSRSPVREALVHLERDGFVTRTSSGRILVVPLDVSDLEQLYVVRAGLEGMATRLAADRLRPIDLEAMRGALDAMSGFVDRGDYVRAIESGKAFHEVLLRECANAPLIELLAYLRGRINRFRFLAAGFDSYDRERLEEHRRILDALYRRAPAEAEAEMINHITRSGAVLVANLHARAAAEAAGAPISSHVTKAEEKART